MPRKPKLPPNTDSDSFDSPDPTRDNVDPSSYEPDLPPRTHRKRDNCLDKTIQKFVDLKDVSYSLSDELSSMNQVINDMPSVYADSMKQFFRNVLKRNTRRQKMTVLLSAVAVVLAGVNILVSQIRGDMEYLKSYNSNLDRAKIQSPNISPEELNTVTNTSKPAKSLRPFTILPSIRFSKKSPPNEFTPLFNIPKRPKPKKTVLFPSTPFPYTQKNEGPSKHPSAYRPSALTKANKTLLEKRVWKPFLNSEDDTLVHRPVTRYSPRRHPYPSSFHPQTRNSLPDLPHPPQIQFEEPQTRNW